MIVCSYSLMENIIILCYTFSKMKEAAVIVVVLMLCSFQAEARSGGAPAAACNTLTPIHLPNQAGGDPFPYVVDLFALANGYEGGKNYRS